MKVQELLENITNENFNLEEALEVKHYLPLELKKTIANGILFECTDDSEGAVKVDSLQRYLSYVKHMIIHHTNLEYTDDDYDTLNSTKYEDSTLLNAIINCFGDDAKECTTILDMIMADYMRTTSIEFAIVKLINSLALSIDGVAGTINNKINEFDFKSLLPDDIDLNQVSNFLEKYNV